MNIKDEMLKSLEQTDIYCLFVDAEFDQFEDWDKLEYSTDPHALMYDLNKKELFFLTYGTPDDGWVKIAEQQNPWRFICFINSANVNEGCDEYIKNCINELFQNIKLWNLSQKGR